MTDSNEKERRPGEIHYLPTRTKPDKSYEIEFGLVGQLAGVAVAIWVGYGAYLAAKFAIIGLADIAVRIWDALI
jgi:hypothetical protein